MSCFFMHPSTLLVMRTRTPPPPLQHYVIYGRPQGDHQNAPSDLAKGLVINYGEGGGGCYKVGKLWV